ncbi:hypothetical protein FAUST_10708 [Fusarium austroamericanum]|uniref:Uncharacterized protein n=1 Tax=Fusarium austroamericanum TaxID=282268 RepID=A0AAN5Z0R0_FUSAU|nr:hypothetical protein FAUST_10708 [Fusarium austroamericanum]
MGRKQRKTGGIKFFVLSSRPGEEILEQLGKIPQITISTDLERDKIIAEKIVETRLAPLTADTKQLVVERLSSLTQGSAIWTTMTVETIAALKIRAPGRMKKPVLSMRWTGTGGPKHGSYGVEILGVARRRLSILELTWAVALGVADPDISTVAEVAELVDTQGIMALIQPFIASTDFKDFKKRQITVVHESAKEFILNELALSRPRLQDVGKLRAEGRAADSLISLRLENNIFDICVRYLLLDEINNLPLFSEEQMAIEELTQNLDLFTDDDDAAAYTTDCSWENWEEGMIRYDPADRGFGECVTAEPLPDLRNIEKLCQANSTRLHNWTSQDSRPDCIVQARFEFDGSLYDPLSIASLYGSEELLFEMLEKSEFESDEFLPNTALVAVDQILQWGDLCRLRMLFFGRETGRYLQNLKFFRLIIDLWRFSNRNYRQNWDIAFGIINDIPDILIRKEWGNKLLCLAAS